MLSAGSGEGAFEDEEVVVGDIVSKTSKPIVEKCEGPGVGRLVGPGEGAFEGVAVYV